ncbi:MAG: rane protein [Myxococcaceae bacterium]|jgi:FtsH-binding integral membrane protein|nr:rane protein [Myxococcaceae bacterium]
MNQAQARYLPQQRESVVSDALWRTYRWMTLGLAITGAVALGVAGSPDAMSVILGNRLIFFGLMLAQLAVVFSFSAIAQRSSTAVVAAMFFAYAALTGVTFSVLFLIYTASSIGSVFLITAGAFGGLSAVGLFTKTDLGPIGRFAIFAVVGLILASLVNMFLASSGLQWMISVAGVLIFGALTAYDTQKLKNLYSSGDVHANMPLVGALTLYLDFINMFLFLLRMFGRRRD